MRKASNHFSNKFLRNNWGKPRESRITQIFDKKKYRIHIKILEAYRYIKLRTSN